MGYRGLRTDATGQYRTLDSISSSFNGTTVTFPLSYNSGTSLEVADERQLIISINGIIQQPTTAYTVSGTNITFTQAPGEGSTFWGLLLGGAYDTLNRELVNTTLQAALYDTTLSPSDALAVLTANTPSLTDDSTKVATTNFVRQRHIPQFRYDRSVTTNVANDTTVTWDFTNGSLSDSDMIVGQSWSSGELTFPAAYYGLWHFNLGFESATNAGATFQIYAQCAVEVWNGSSWITEQVKQAQSGTWLNSQIFPVFGTFTTLITGTRNKIRCRLYQINTNTSAYNWERATLNGLYLGGNT